MEITFPHVIENWIGEKLIFQEIQKDDEGERVIVENFVKPGSGPVMHTHWLQDEQFTILKGKVAYQIKNQPVQYADEGETVLFKRGLPHRFWNAGQEVLHCKGFISPANTIVFFLSSVFAAQNKSGKSQPEQFDGAYLLHRYASEYDIDGIPAFVKRFIIPFTYFVGKLLGKYKHFKGAPAPIRAPKKSFQPEK
jgi:quercetin dioxygenase-like cupin family protein